MKLTVALLLLTTSVTALPAQESNTSNPYNSPEDVIAGGHIFRSHCLGCHGREGTGGRGPDLTRTELRYGNTDLEMANIIADGIPGTEMPNFFFNGRQLWQIVSFVQSLRQASPQFQVSGNTETGASLFRGKGGCLKCHRVNGEGARAGPDLSQVGARRSPNHLRASLLEPGRFVSPLYRRVHAITLDGRRFSGTRLNEDTYSLQLLDHKENLISLLKSDLKEYRLDGSSAMPSYKGVFFESELEDLVAYLYSLRRKEPQE